PAATSVWPKPMESGARQRRCADSRSIAPRHWKLLSGKPCKNKTAGPVPRSMYAIRPNVVGANFRSLSYRFAASASESVAFVSPARPLLRAMRATNEPATSPPAVRQKTSTVHVHPSDCDLALTYRAQEFHWRASI